MEINIAKITESMGIAQLNKLQQQTLEVDIDRDLLILSPTGSGKTLAYILAAIPFVECSGDNAKVIVLSPSRELAIQSAKVFGSTSTGAKNLCCYGGHSLEVERRSIRAGVDIIFATPGRMLYHLRKNVNGSFVDAIVIDEYDKLVELGFEQEISSIIEHLPNVKRRILTSATTTTLPGYLNIKKPITIDNLDSNKPEITTMRIESGGDDLGCIVKLLSQIEGRSSIIFCNFREDALMVSNYLNARNIVNEFFHGGMEQRERERRLCKFRNGSTDILIATDLAARGIDILSIDNVIHFHAPLTVQSLTHRNGRTARIGAKGAAYIIDSKKSSLTDSYPIMSLEECKQNIAEPRFATLYIGKGKKDKVNKIDIVGFICSNAGVTKNQIGEIDVKDFYSYVAIERESCQYIYKSLRNKKIKKRAAKIDMCM